MEFNAPDAIGVLRLGDRWRHANRSFLDRSRLLHSLRFRSATGRALSVL